MSSLQIFLLCYNRPGLASEAIRSILDQSFQNFELVISDNSTHSPLSPTDIPDDPRITYRRRTPSISSPAHFKLVTTEVTSEFYMLLHDDDLFMPEMIGQLYDQLNRNPKISAVCPNAYFKYDTKNSSLLLNPKIEKSMFFSNPRDFLTRYFLPDLGVNPFPAYMYRRSLCEKETIGTGEAGKYSDATYLARLTLWGPILWLAEPLLYYRVHANNDSGAISIRDFKKMIVWSVRNNFFRKKDFPVKTARTWYLFLKLREKKRKNRALSIRGRLLLLNYILRHPFYVTRFLFSKALKAVRKRLSTK